MKYVATGSEMSEIDNYTINDIGIPQMVLMERAALAVVIYLKSNFGKDSKVLVAVESGNNGGDGLAVARLLAQEGYDVSVYWVDGLEKKSEAFVQQYNIARKLRLKFVDDIVNCGYDVVIDGIFGVGLSRTVTGKQADTIKALNDLDAYKLAIDIPSGIDSYTGFVLGTAFRADATVTFGLMKLGLLMGIGSEYAGKVVVADIGFPDKAINAVNPRLYTYDSTDVEKLLPYRKSDTHKGSYGKVGVIAGSKNMAGACIFAAEAAYRMGCGLVRVCTVEENREIMQTRLPEAMLTTFSPENKASIREALKQMMLWADVIIVGPGLGNSETTQYIVDKILKNFDKQVVLDADGLNVLSGNLDIIEGHVSKLIITPHLMEMSRITGIKTGDIKENKYEIAKDFANKYEVVVVLKDARTFVSDGGEQAYINTTGNNGMATGGSGDVLTGVIAGLCAQGMEGFDAAKLGVCMHGLAGQEAAIVRGRYSMIAGDIVRGITRVLEGDYYVN